MINNACYVGGEMVSKVRWLHISDFHIGNQQDKLCGYLLNGSSGSAQSARNLDEGGLNYLLKDEGKSVDFIVFTGDLFDKGKWDSGRVEKALKFLTAIYECCSAYGKWKNAEGKPWKKGDPMDRLFYCPGNHDVLRQAYISDGETITHRKDVLGKSMDKGYFSPGANEKLLTEQTFSPFDNAMVGLVKPNEGSGLLQRSRFEAVSFATNHPDFCVVGINTALLAGQLSPMPEAEEILEAHTKLLDAIVSLEDKKVVEINYEQYKSMIRKQMGEVVDDKGKLAFVSREVADTLKAETSTYSLPIYFGHHPLEFFDGYQLCVEEKKYFGNITRPQNAYQAFCDVVGQDRYAIYLCGHVHRPRIEKHLNVCTANREPNARVLQIAVGGMFVDTEEYNQISFSLGSAEITRINEIEDMARVKVEVDIYRYMLSLSGKYSWERQSVDETLFLGVPQIVPTTREQSGERTSGTNTDNRDEKKMPNVARGRSGERTSETNTDDRDAKNTPNVEQRQKDLGEGYDHFMDISQFYGRRT